MAVFSSMSRRWMGFEITLKLCFSASIPRAFPRWVFPLWKAFHKGKTHLAISLGVKAVEAGYSVLFLTLEALMTRLTKALNENRLDHSWQQLSYPKLLIIDELGYLSLSRIEASLFFAWLLVGMNMPAWLFPVTKAFWIGEKYSMIPYWPLPFWIVFYTTPLL